MWFCWLWLHWMLDVVVWEGCEGSTTSTRRSFFVNEKLSSIESEPLRTVSFSSSRPSPKIWRGNKKAQQDTCVRSDIEFPTWPDMYILGFTGFFV
jgi:hypothetical protein